MATVMMLGEIRMTRYDVEQLLSNVLDGLPKFCNTMDSEFAINWRAQKIMFYGKYHWSYSIYDKAGNEVNKISDINELVENSDVVFKVDNCDSLVISWIDAEQNECDLQIGLRDSEKLNVEKIKTYLLEAKEKLLEFDYDYWKDYRKMHEWTMMALKHTSVLKKKLMEYESAALEPDMNIISYIRKEINAEIDKFETDFQHHFFPEKSNLVER